jgi:hypothetical protein
MGGQHFFASGMNGARRGADLGIGERGDIFLEEINQPTFALEQ